MGVHDGHRKRVRQRLKAEGLEAFAPHEVLELLLFYGRPRGDVNPAAHALMDKFGSLRGVLEAPMEQLQTVAGIGEESAALIAMLVPLFRRYQQECRSNPTVIRHRREAEQYCISLLSGYRQERFVLISLGAKGQLLGQRTIGEGSLSEVPAYPRLVAEAVLSHNGHSAILCHNHPGGTCAPSPADRQTTHEIHGLLHGLGVLLLDHIIVAGQEAYSMAAHGEIVSREMSAGERRLRESWLAEG